MILSGFGFAVVMGNSTRVCSKGQSLQSEQHIVYSAGGPHRKVCMYVCMHVPYFQTPTNSFLFHHSFLEFKMAAGVRVYLGVWRGRVCGCIYCTEVCWSKGGGVELFRNETAAAYMTGLGLLFFIPPIVL